MNKKIELNSDQRNLIRELLDQCIWSHEDELKNGGYTESGINLATTQIYQAAQIIEKLNFDVLVDKSYKEFKPDYYEDFDQTGYQLVHGKWIKYSDLQKFAATYEDEIPQ